MPEPALVSVGGQAAGDVLIGANLVSRLPAALDGATRVLLIHSEPLTYVAETVRAQLTAFRVKTVVVPDAEAGKTAAVTFDLWEVLGREGFTRSDAIVGIGGGAVTDLAGFVAATWLRGVKVVHVATSLLGMVDAAVGGKTGINTAAGKNMVGSFHPPAAVFADVATLRTLAPEHFRAGLAEVIKCGFIADPAILDLVTDHVAELNPEGDLDVVVELVRRAVQVKADVVTVDLRDTGPREFLNYGHTLGHAIELFEDFQWRHGDGVAVGMVYAAEIAYQSGRIDAELLMQHRSILSAVGLPTTYPGGRWTELRDAMSRDKKSRGDTIRLVVLDGLAKPVRFVDPNEELLRAGYEAISVG